MAEEGLTRRELFSSKFGAVLTAAGAAVGLGNIWGFPYVAGRNGGGAFVLIYLVSVILIGIPLMISEFIIGQKGGKNVIGSFEAIKPKSKWVYGGWLGLIAAFFILGFYGVVAGWSMANFFKALIGGVGGLSSEEIGGSFGAFIEGYWPVFWHLVFMMSTAFIVVAGIKRGIEKFARIIMPALFGILVLLAIYGVVMLRGSGEGLAFLFAPDWSVVSWKTIAIAIGAAFFSMGVGNGVMITIGSYMEKGTNLGKSAFQIAMTDTLVAVIAGVAIFPAVFALGFEPTSSGALAFVTVPSVLQLFPGGAIVHYIFTLLFFFLLSVAALTSSVTTLELVVAYFVEEKQKSRKKSSYTIAGIMFLIGIPCALSVGAVPAINIGGIPFVWFLVDFLEAFVLPAGGIVFTLFVGWVIKKEDVIDLLKVDGRDQWYLHILYTLIKYIIPVAVFIILVYTANEYFFHFFG